MKYKALTSFSGSISMYKDEIRELTDENLIKDLTKAGYIMSFVKIERSKPGVKMTRGKQVARSKKGGAK